MEISFATNIILRHTVFWISNQNFICMKGKVRLSKVSFTRNISLSSYCDGSRKGQEAIQYVLATNIIGNTLISHARSFIMQTRSSRTLITFTVCFRLHYLQSAQIILTVSQWKDLHFIHYISYGCENKFRLLNFNTKKEWSWSRCRYKQ